MTQITVVSGIGLCTSLLMKISIKSILNELAVAAKVNHVDLNSAKGMNSDIFVGTRDITKQLVAQSIAGKIVSLDNVIDKKIMKERLSVALIELNIL